MTGRDDLELQPQSVPDEQYIPLGLRSAQPAAQETKWTWLVGAAVLVLLDHWFIRPVLIVALVIGLVWLGRLVFRRGSWF